MTLAPSRIFRSNGTAYSVAMMAYTDISLALEV